METQFICHHIYIERFAIRANSPYLYGCSLVYGGLLKFWCHLEV